MNEIAEKDVINIENMIYEIDGKEVMFDSDLAILYDCKNGTKEINQAVKNNPDKFPDIELQKKNIILWSQKFWLQKVVLEKDI